MNSDAIRHAADIFAFALKGIAWLVALAGVALTLRLQEGTPEKLLLATAAVAVGTLLGGVAYVVHLLTIISHDLRTSESVVAGEKTTATPK